jgi:cation:H+ antiporter
LLETIGLLGNILVLLTAILILDRASDLVINNAVKIADLTGFGKTTIGFILAAMGTTLPELSVSIFAAITGESVAVAIGNVLGSCIVNICLILGVAFVLTAVRNPNCLQVAPMLAREETGTLYFGLFAASAIPLALIYIGEASRIIGVILVAIFVYHTYLLSKTRRMKEEGGLGAEYERLNFYVLVAFISAIIVVTSAYFIVNSAVYIARAVGIPEVVIGSTIVAFGTSLPEFANSVKSSQKGHLDLALGNIVGSNFINTTLILGASLIGSPLIIHMRAFTNVVLFSLITSLLLWYFLSSERTGWREGFILLFLYAVFLFVSYGGYRT